MATIIGLINYLFSETHNVLQQIALAGITLVIVIIPYCLARAVSEANKEKGENLLANIIQIQRDCFNLQKVKLIQDIVMNKVNIDFNYELVTERIERLENLKINEIISDEEFTKYKRELLNKLQKKIDYELKKTN